MILVPNLSYTHVENFQLGHRTTSASFTSCWVTVGFILDTLFPIASLDPGGNGELKKKYISYRCWFCWVPHFTQADNDNPIDSGFYCQWFTFRNCILIKKFLKPWNVSVILCIFHELQGFVVLSHLIQIVWEGPAYNNNVEKKFLQFISMTVGQEFHIILISTYLIYPCIQNSRTCYKRFQSFKLIGLCNCRVTLQQMSLLVYIIIWI